jgi:hypothetical protein
MTHFFDTMPLKRQRFTATPMCTVYIGVAVNVDIASKNTNLFLACVCKFNPTTPYTPFLINKPQPEPEPEPNHTRTNLFFKILLILFPTLWPLRKKNQIIQNMPLSFVTGSATVNAAPDTGKIRTIAIVVAIGIIAMIVILIVAPIFKRSSLRTKAKPASTHAVDDANHARAQAARSRWRMVPAHVEQQAIARRAAANADTASEIATSSAQVARTAASNARNNANAAGTAVLQAKNDIIQARNDVSAASIHVETAKRDVDKMSYIGIRIKDRLNAAIALPIPGLTSPSLVRMKAVIKSNFSQFKTEYNDALTAMSNAESALAVADSIQTAATNAANAAESAAIAANAAAENVVNAIDPGPVDVMAVTMATATARAFEMQAEHSRDACDDKVETVKMNSDMAIEKISSVMSDVHIITTALAQVEELRILASTEIAQALQIARSDATADSIAEAVRIAIDEDDEEEAVVAMTAAETNVTNARTSANNAKQSYLTSVAHSSDATDVLDLTQSVVLEAGAKVMNVSLYSLVGKPLDVAYVDGVDSSIDSIAFDSNEISSITNTITTDAQNMRTKLATFQNPEYEGYFANARDALAAAVTASALSSAASVTTSNASEAAGRYSTSASDALGNHDYLSVAAAAGSANASAIRATASLESCDGFATEVTEKCDEATEMASSAVDQVRPLEQARTDIAIIRARLIDNMAQLLILTNAAAAAADDANAANAANALSDAARILVDTARNHSNDANDSSASALEAFVATPMSLATVREDIEVTTASIVESARTRHFDMDIMNARIQRRLTTVVGFDVSPESDVKILLDDMEARASAIDQELATITNSTYAVDYTAAQSELCDAEVAHAIADASQHMAHAGETGARAAAIAAQEAFEEFDALDPENNTLSSLTIAAALAESKSELAADGFAKCTTSLQTFKAAISRAISFAANATSASALIQTAYLSVSAADASATDKYNEILAIVGQRRSDDDDDFDNETRLASAAADNVILASDAAADAENFAIFATDTSEAAQDTVNDCTKLFNQVVIRVTGARSHRISGGSFALRYNNIQQFVDRIPIPHGEDIESLIERVEHDLSTVSEIDTEFHALGDSIEEQFPVILHVIINAQTAGNLADASAAFANSASEAAQDNSTSATSMNLEQDYLRVAILAGAATANATRANASLASVVSQVDVVYHRATIFNTLMTSQSNGLVSTLDDHERLYSQIENALASAHSKRLELNSLLASVADNSTLQDVDVEAARSAIDQADTHASAAETAMTSALTEVELARTNVAIAIRSQLSAIEAKHVAETSFDLGKKMLSAVDVIVRPTSQVSSWIFVMTSNLDAMKATMDDLKGMITHQGDAASEYLVSANNALQVARSSATASRSAATNASNERDDLAETVTLTNVVTVATAAEAAKLYAARARAEMNLCTAQSNNATTYASSANAASALANQELSRVGKFRSELQTSLQFFGNISNSIWASVRNNARLESDAAMSRATAANVATTTAQTSLSNANATFTAVNSSVAVEHMITAILTATSQRLKIVGAFFGRSEADILLHTTNANVFLNQMETERDTYNRHLDAASTAVNHATQTFAKITTYNDQVQRAATDANQAETAIASDSNESNQMTAQHATRVADFAGVAAYGVAEIVGLSEPDMLKIGLVTSFNNNIDIVLEQTQSMGDSMARFEGIQLKLNRLHNTVFP